MIFIAISFIFFFFRLCKNKLKIIKQELVVVVKRSTNTCEKKTSSFTLQFNFILLSSRLHTDKNKKVVLTKNNHKLKKYFENHHLMLRDISLLSDLPLKLNSFFLKSHKLMTFRNSNKFNFLHFKMIRASQSSRENVWNRRSDVMEKWIIGAKNEKMSLF